MNRPLGATRSYGHGSVDLWTACPRCQTPRWVRKERIARTFLCRDCAAFNRRRPLKLRVWSHVVKTETCWLWNGKRSEQYPTIRVGDTMRHVGRLIYEWTTGPIPPRLELDHLCRVHSCIRPSHLEAVPTRVNILRGNGIAAQCARRTHCPKGHPLSGENLHPKTLPYRRCWICARAYQRWYTQHRRNK